MKFENPIMNISMFAVENVVTEASGVQTGRQKAEEAAKEAINGLDSSTYGASTSLTVIL